MIAMIVAPVSVTLGQVQIERNSWLIERKTDMPE